MDHKNTQKSPLIKTYVYQLFIKIFILFFFNEASYGKE